MCVRWASNQSQLPMGIECWSAPAACLVTPPLGTSFSRCNCFNPCLVRHPGGGTFCFDQNSRPDLVPDGADVACVLGQP